MVLRKLPRNATLDGVDLFRRLDLGNAGTPLDDENRVDAFIGELRQMLKTSLATESTVRGWRAQALFASVVVALDACDLMTTVDIGEIYFDGADIKAPDFFLHLRDGRRILVDVKDVATPLNEETVERPIKFSASEVRRLRAFAERFGAVPHIAVYISAIMHWALISLDDLEEGPGGGYRTTLARAVMRNRMEMLGDLVVGTEWPIEIAFTADTTKPHHVDPDGKAQFTIGGVEMKAGGRLVRSRAERQIVQFFMLYGNWDQEERAVIEDSLIKEIRWIASPPEPTDQGWEILGSLSEMYSRLFELNTRSPEAITSLDIKIDPATMTTLIPHDFDSDELRLWRFTMMPNLEDQ